LCLRSFSNLFSARGNTFARMCLLARSGPQLILIKFSISQKNAQFKRTPFLKKIP
jgi:hypothetical protein